MVRSDLITIPNAISLARILALPVLWLALAFSNRPLVGWLLLACLLSDIADGYLARLLKQETSFGALLDSVADAGLFLTSLGSILIFEPELVREHGPAFLLVPGLYLLELLLALGKYGRLTSFHTYLSKLAAYALGAFLVLLLLRGFSPGLFYGAVAISSLAYLEEIILVGLLPAWKANVKGLYWISRNTSPCP